MTDNEIIKAWECCIGGYGVRNCDNCPNMGYGCTEVIPRIALDLLSRQKAEIERLEYIRKGDEQLINSLNKCYKLAKSEVIKEFARKLENALDNRLCDDIPILGDRDNVYCAVSDIYDVIDNLVKEMTEVEE